MFDMMFGGRLLKYGFLIPEAPGARFFSDLIELTMSRLLKGSVLSLISLMLCRFIVHSVVSSFVFLLNSCSTIVSVSWQNSRFSSSLIAHVFSSLFVNTFSISSSVFAIFSEPFSLNFNTVVRLLPPPDMR